MIDLVERGEDRSSEFGASASDAREENDSLFVSNSGQGLNHTRRWPFVQATFQVIARLHAAHSSQSACGGGRDLAIKVAQQFDQRRHDIASHADATAGRCAYRGNSNVAGASARRRVEISRQAAKLQSPLRRELALGRCPWRSFDRRIEKRRVRQWRQEPLMLRLAPEPCNRRQSRRNDCKESQARSLRHLAAAFRLRPQAHRRQQAPSRGERRSTPRPTSFLGQGAALAAHSKTLGSAHGQQTGRVDCAPSYSQICPGRGTRFNKFGDLSATRERDLHRHVASSLAYATSKISKEEKHAERRDGKSALR